MKNNINIVVEFAKRVSQDKEFMDYYNSFQNNKDIEAIGKVVSNFSNIKNQSEEELARFSDYVNELKEGLEKLDKKFEDNVDVQEFKDFYKKTDSKVLNAIFNQYLKNDGLSKISEETTEKKNLQPSDARKIIQQLEKRGVGELLKNNKALEKIDLDNLKIVYEWYERLDKLELKKSFFSNFKKLVDDESVLREALGYDKKQIEDTSSYTDDHMRMIGEKLLGGAQYIERLTYKTINEEFINKYILNQSKPVFISFNVNNAHWVALCILKTNDKLTVLCKDSLGNAHNDIREKIKIELKKAQISFEDKNFISHTKKEQKDSHNDGPMTLKNLELMARIIWEGGVENIINKFGDIQFCDSLSAHNIRREHNEILILKDKEDKIKSHGLVIQVIETLNSLKNNSDLYKDEKIFNPLLKMLDDAIKSNNRQAKEVKADMLSQIADEYVKLGKFSEAFKYIEKAILTYKSEKIEKKKAMIEQKLQEINSTSLGNGEKNQADLLKEIVETKAKVDVDGLNLGLNKVKASIPKYQNYTKGDILNWANNVRKQDIKDIGEYLAIIDRANYIDTFEHGGVGHHLRDTQILSVLSFFHASGNGRLDQIKTGEGKSTIVSVLAIIQALRGKYVDVLTSSAVLAERDAKEKENLYKLFGLTVSDNGMDAGYSSGPKECYKANILYGSISNFQFDLLKHEHQGLETRGTEGNVRGFDTVIIDEADSMLIDNGGHLAKLSGPLPGMEYLQPLLVYIWSQVIKVAPPLEFLMRLTGKELQDIEKVQSLKNDLIKDVNAVIKHGSMKLPTNAGDKECKIFIPKHLNEYINGQAGKWIDHAFNAALIYKKDREYVIKKKEGGEEIIAPVDHSNTGTIQTGTIWSDGLHQFLQLKHGLHLTAESCNTSFISNIGYIKRYINGTPSIFGLTGTLGGVEERELLSKSYDGLDFLDIPTYKPKIFTKEPTILKRSHEEWLDCIVEDTIKRSNERAVLIICDTIEEVNEIYEKIKERKQVAPEKIRVYLEDDQSNVTKAKMNIGDILIATNLAGRGTDLGTEADLENNGGLHVCVTFMPSNQRVEDQALGRTSRQGKKGTGQLIIKEDKLVKELKKHVDEHLKSKDINEKISNDNYVKMLEVVRNEIEKQRVCSIAGKKLQAINIADDLFNKFSALCKDKKEANKDPWYSIVIRAIEERWGFWLKDLDLNNKEEINKEEINKQFELFKQKIGTGTIDVIENPYYLISIGQFHLGCRKYVQAKKVLEKAIKLAGDDRVAASAHYLLAFTEIYLAQSVEEVITNAIKALVPFLKLGNKSDRDYAVKQSLGNLEKAELGIKGIQEIYTDIMNACSVLPTEYPGSGIKNSPPLMNHLMSKINLFNLYNMYIGINKSSIEKCHDTGKNNKGYMTIQNSIKLELESLNFGGANNQELQKIENHFKDTIKDPELKELSSIGLRDIFYVSKVKDIPQDRANWINGQILAGIAQYGVAIAFPPAAPVLLQTAGACISEAMSELTHVLVAYCLNDNCSEFNAKEYNKNKTVSLIKSVALAGIGALANMGKISNDAIQAAERMYKTLEKIDLSNLKEFAIKEILEMTLDGLGLGAIKKIVDISSIQNLKEFNISNMVNVIASIPEINIEGLNELVKDVKVFASYIEGFAQLKDIVENKDLVGMLQKFPATNIPELDSIREKAGQVGAFYNVVKSGGNIGEIVKNIPNGLGENLGIKELDSIMKCTMQAGNFLKAVQSGKISDMVNNIPSDLPDQLNIKEIKDIAASAKQIGAFYNAVKSGNVADIVKNIPNNLSKDLKIPELNNVLTGINQMRNFCEAAKSGNFMNIVNLEAQFGNIKGELPQLQGMMDYVKKVQDLHSMDSEKTFAQIHNIIPEETRIIFNSFLGENFGSEQVFNQQF